MSDLAIFGHLSRQLTGERSLAEYLVAPHLARLRADAEVAPLLGRLLDTFAQRAAQAVFHEEAFRQEVALDPELGPLVRRLVVLWVTGTLPKVDWARAPRVEGDSAPHGQGELSRLPPTSLDASTYLTRLSQRLLELQTGLVEAQAAATYAHAQMARLQDALREAAATYEQAVQQLGR